MVVLEKTQFRTWATGVRFQIWRSQNTSTKDCEEDQNSKNVTSCNISHKLLGPSLFLEKILEVLEWSTSQK